MLSFPALRETFFSSTRTAWVILSINMRSIRASIFSQQAQHQSSCPQKILFSTRGAAMIRKCEANIVWIYFLACPENAVFEREFSKFINLFQVIPQQSVVRPALGQRRRICAAQIRLVHTESTHCQWGPRLGEEEESAWNKFASHIEAGGHQQKKRLSVYVEVRMMYHCWFLHSDTPTVNVDSLPQPSLCLSVEFCPQCWGAKDKSSMVPAPR